MTEKLLLSIPEAAETLGISPRTVFSLMAKGDVATVKIGSRTLIARSELDRFIVEHARAS